MGKAREIIQSKKYDLIILDEINVALRYKLININDVMDVLNILITDNSILRTDTILTGRYLHPRLKKIADLITEMKEVKHYYNSGTKARKGIEY